MAHQPRSSREFLHGDQKPVQSKTEMSTRQRRMISNAAFRKMVRDPYEIFPLTTWHEIFRRGFFTVMKNGCPLHRVAEIAATVNVILGRKHRTGRSTSEERSFDEATSAAAREIERWALDGVRQIEK